MKSLRKITLVINACLLLCIACSPYPKEVEAAIALSGDNKAELIKVLEHYKDSNKLKFEAACFLISNMPYHKSHMSFKLSNRYFSYFKKVDSICQHDSTAILNDSLKRALSEQFNLIVAPTTKAISTPDIQILTADFLIENIEMSFYEWQHSPLLKSISFEEFKEWILPYRTADEALVDNKRILKSIIYNRLSSNGMDDIRKPIECYKKYVRVQKEMNKQITAKYHIGTFDLFIPAFKRDCSSLSTRTCNFFRSCGIPTVYEFTPQWPDKDSKHYWCASPDSNGVLQPHTPPYNNLREDWPMDLKYAAKVYQRTFGAMKDTPYFLKKKDEILPTPFDIPTLKDVTDRYHSCIKLTLPLDVQTNRNLVYLSFFNTEGDLTPVAWGTINKREQSAVFEKVPVNILFFPSYMEDDGIITPFHKPFILRQDSTTKQIVREEVSCNTDQKQLMHLLRKYPSKRHLKSYRQDFKNARLLGANNWGGPYDTLLIIKDALEPYYQEYVLSNTKKFRYYRLQSNRALLNIAELEFLGKDIPGHRFSVPAPLPIFSAKDIKRKENKLKKISGEPQKTGNLYQNSYDGNPETFANWGFFGMDFRRPTCISSIRLLPRTSLNTIEPNCHYQLLYYHNQQWVEFKNITAEYNFLDIDSVPSATIYWLRNLDKGKEELPFFYKNGKQIFINEYM